MIAAMTDMLLRENGWRKKGKNWTRDVLTRSLTTFTFKITDEGRTLIVLRQDGTEVSRATNTPDEIATTAIALAHRLA